MSGAIIHLGPPGSAPGGAEPCGVCLTLIPPGAHRCPGCGKPTAAAEVCPHCHNPSPAVPYFSRSGPGCLVTLLYGLGGAPGAAYRKAHENELVCALCGGSRGFAANPLAAADAQRGGPPLPPDQAVLRAAQLEAQGQGRSLGLKIVAALLAAGGLGLLLLTLLFDSGILTAFGVVGLVFALAAAAGLFVAGRGLRKRYDREAEVVRLRAVADLARKHGGLLRLDQAARELRLPASQAEHLLSALVDHERVHLDVQDDGQLLFRFSDWMPAEPALAAVERKQLGDGGDQSKR